MKHKLVVYSCTLAILLNLWVTGVSIALSYIHRSPNRASVGEQLIYYQFRRIGELNGLVIYLYPAGYSPLFSFDPDFTCPESSLALAGQTIKFTKIADRLVITGNTGARLTWPAVSEAIVALVSRTDEIKPVDLGQRTLFRLRVVNQKVIVYPETKP